MDRMTNAIKIAIAVVKAAAAQTLPASVLASGKCSCTGVQVQAMTDRVQLPARHTSDSRVHIAVQPLSNTTSAMNATELPQEQYQGKPLCAVPGKG